MRVFYFFFFYKMKIVIFLSLTINTCSKKKQNSDPHELDECDGGKRVDSEGDDSGWRGWGEGICLNFTFFREHWKLEEVSISSNFKNQVPPEFVLQRTNVANPPSMFYVVERLIQNKMVFCQESHLKR